MSLAAMTLILCQLLNEAQDTDSTAVFLFTVRLDHTNSSHCAVVSVIPGNSPDVENPGGDLLL